MLRIPLTTDAVKYLNQQRVLTAKLKHSDVEWYSYLLFNFIAQQMIPHLQPGKRCLDIGAGLGLVNVFLRDIYNEIYLYDKTVSVEKLEDTYYGFHNRYCYYSNLDIAKDLNPDFNVTDVLNFPNNHFDMVQSHMSWCWHYPKEIYYDEVLRILKPNGLLVVDVWTKMDYTFNEFQEVSRLENREDESFKLILKRKN